jgi:hypothetical protein
MKWRTFLTIRFQWEPRALLVVAFIDRNLAMAFLGLTIKVGVN